MATESVNFVISAEDKASAKLRQTRDELDKTVKSVRDVGGKAKASTELVGSLANTLGGSWLGSAAGQVAQLTERMSAFAEVGKASRGAMLLFKAGLVAAAGAMTYQLTTAIAKQVTGFDKLKASIESARNELEAITSKANAMAQRKFDFDLAKISLIEDPEEQEKQLREVLDKTQIAVEKSTAEFIKQRERLTELKGDTFFGYQSGAHQEDIKQQETALNVAKAAMEQAEQQRQVVRDQLTYEKELNQMRADIAARKEAEAAKEKAANDARVAAEKEALKLQQDQARERQKIADSTMSAVDQLQLQITKLKDGDEAARSLQLTMQGIDESTANQIASLEAMIAAIQNGKQGMTGPANAGPNNALESRFLSGRTVTTDYTKVTAEQTKKTAELNAQQLKMLEEAQAELRRIAENTENPGFEDAR